MDIKQNVNNYDITRIDKHDLEDIINNLGIFFNNNGGILKEKFITASPLIFSYDDKFQHTIETAIRQLYSNIEIFKMNINVFIKDPNKILRELPTIINDSQKVMNSIYIYLINTKKKKSKDMSETNIKEIFKQYQKIKIIFDDIINKYNQRIYSVLDNEMIINKLKEYFGSSSYNKNFEQTVIELKKAEEKKKKIEEEFDNATDKKLQDERYVTSKKLEINSLNQIIKENKNKSNMHLTNSDILENTISNNISQYQKTVRNIETNIQHYNNCLECINTLESSRTLNQINELSKLLKIDFDISSDEEIKCQPFLSNLYKKIIFTISNDEMEKIQYTKDKYYFYNIYELKYGNNFLSSEEKNLIDDFVNTSTYNDKLKSLYCIIINDNLRLRARRGLLNELNTLTNKYTNKNFEVIETLRDEKKKQIDEIRYMSKEYFIEYKTRIEDGKFDMSDLNTLLDPKKLEARYELVIPFAQITRYERAKKVTLTDSEIEAFLDNFILELSYYDKLPTEVFMMTETAINNYFIQKKASRYTGEEITKIINKYQLYIKFITIIHRFYSYKDLYNRPFYLLLYHILSQDKNVVDNYYKDISSLTTKNESIKDTIELLFKQCFVIDITDFNLSFSIKKVIINPKNNYNDIETISKINIIKNIYSDNTENRSYVFILDLLEYFYKLFLKKDYKNLDFSETFNAEYLKIIKLFYKSIINLRILTRFFDFGQNFTQKSNNKKLLNDMYTEIDTIDKLNKEQKEQKELKNGNDEQSNSIKQIIDVTYKYVKNNIHIKNKNINSYLKLRKNERQGNNESNNRFTYYLSSENETMLRFIYFNTQNKMNIDNYKNYYKDTIDLYNDFLNNEDDDININYENKDIFIEKYSIFNINNIFDYEKNNKEIIAENDNLDSLYNNTIRKLLNETDIVILGYGQSGSGKTSTLINLNLGEKSEIGILGHILYNDDIFKKYDEIILKNVEIYYHFDLKSTNLTNVISKYRTIVEESNGLNYKDIDMSQNSVKIDMRYGKRFIAHQEINKYDGNKSNKWIDVETFQNMSKDIKNDEDRKNIKDIIDFILDLFDYRITRPTTNNPESSRSHFILNINLIKDKKISSNIYLCDFAGVENKFNCDDKDELGKLYSKYKFNENKYKDSKDKEKKSNLLLSSLTEKSSLDEDEKYSNNFLEHLQDFNIKNYYIPLNEILDYDIEKDVKLINSITKRFEDPYKMYKNSETIENKKQIIINIGKSYHIRKTLITIYKTFLNEINLYNGGYITEVNKSFEVNEKDLLTQKRKTFYEHMDKHMKWINDNNHLIGQLELVSFTENISKYRVISHTISRLFLNNDIKFNIYYYNFFNIFTEIKQSILHNNKNAANNDNTINSLNLTSSQRTQIALTIINFFYNLLYSNNYQNYIISSTVKKDLNDAYFTEILDYTTLKTLMSQIFITSRNSGIKNIKDFINFLNKNKLYEENNFRNNINSIFNKNDILKDNYITTTMKTLIGTNDIKNIQQKVKYIYKKNYPDEPYVFIMYNKDHIPETSENAIKYHFNHRKDFLYKKYNRKTNKKEPFTFKEFFNTPLGKNIMEIIINDKTFYGEDNAKEYEDIKYSIDRLKNYDKPGESDNDDTLKKIFSFEFLLKIETLNNKNYGNKILFDDIIKKECIIRGLEGEIINKSLKSLNDNISLLNLPNKKEYYYYDEFLIPECFNNVYIFNTKIDKYKELIKKKEELEINSSDRTNQNNELFLGNSISNAFKVLNPEIEFKKLTINTITVTNLNVDFENPPKIPFINLEYLIIFKEYLDFFKDLVVHLSNYDEEIYTNTLDKLIQTFKKLFQSIINKITILYSDELRSNLSIFKKYTDYDDLVNQLVNNYYQKNTEFNYDYNNFIEQIENNNKSSLIGSIYNPINFQNTVYKYICKLDYNSNYLNDIKNDISTKVKTYYEKSEKLDNDDSKSKLSLFHNNDYYEKYIKYKIKYLETKNNIIL